MPVIMLTDTLGSIIGDKADVVLSQSAVLFRIPFPGCANDDY